MRITQSPRLTVLFLFGLALPLLSWSQVYTLSTPLWGGDVSVDIYNSATGASAVGDYLITDLSETIYYDPAAQTIRQVGVLSGAPWPMPYSFSETQSVQGQAITGTVTGTIAPTRGALTFDTGVQAMTPFGGGQSYFNAPIELGDFTVAYSLSTGGRIYTGSFAADYFPWAGSLSAFRAVATDDYPNSLRMNDAAGAAQYIGMGGANVTADNGFVMNLAIGGGYGEQIQWVTFYPTYNVKAYLVPEPASVALISLGLFGLVGSRRWIFSV